MQAELDDQAIFCHHSMFRISTLLGQKKSHTAVPALDVVWIMILDLILLFLVDFVHGNFMSNFEHQIIPK